MKELEKIYKEFGDKLSEVAKDAISDVICEYVPYAETDKVMNVEMRTRDWLKKFFDGEGDEIDNPVLNEYSCKKARELIYQDHKQEIVELIGKDKDDEIERLKIRIEHLEKMGRY